MRIVSSVGAGRGATSRPYHALPRPSAHTGNLPFDSRGLQSSPGDDGLFPTTHVLRGALPAPFITARRVSSERANVRSRRTPVSRRPDACRSPKRPKRSHAAQNLASTRWHAGCSSPRRRRPRMQTARVIVVGFDYSPLSEAALHRALRMTEAVPFATLHAVTVGTRVGADVRLPDGAVMSQWAAVEAVRIHLRERVRAVPDIGARNLRVIGHVRGGEPSQAILDLAFTCNAEKIVM